MKEIALAKFPLENIVRFLLDFRIMNFKTQKMALAVKFTEYQHV